MQIAQKIPYLGAVLCLICLPLLGQDGMVTRDRFVTLIKPQYENGSIVVSFEPIEGEDLRYRVYRAENPIISTSDIEKAEFVGEITADNIPFIDKPEVDGTYYYAVTVTEEFPELVPFVNTTTKAVDFAPMPEVIDRYETIRLDATEEGTQKLFIRFIPSTEGYAYNLYTSMLPFEKTTDASLAASVVAADEQFGYTLQRDSPLYFAITAINRLGVENTELISGRNLTPGPVVAEEKPVPVATVEEELPKEEAPVEPAGPTPRDMIDRILRNSFYQGRYGSALQDLEALFARDDLTDEERGLVAFYMGQCHFYLGEYRRAVKYFVLSKDAHTYREAADAWIERSLSREP
jgi:hypothetical protein